MDKVPRTKLNIKKEVPIIGGANKEMQEVADKTVEKHMQRFMQTLEPIISALNQNVDTIERRLSVVEEVKQTFPSKVDVTVKTEIPKALTDIIKNLQSDE